jgi:hypothetical protein
MSGGFRRRAKRAVVVAATVAGWLAIPSGAQAAGPWTRVPSPSPNPERTALSAVSCVSPTRCTAVGGFSHPRVVRFVRTLIVRTTDGTTWTRVASPNPGEWVNGLNGVSCSSGTVCMAVGIAFPIGDAPPPPLVLRTTDGTTWRHVAAPAVGVTGFGASDVSCSTSTDCMLVGEADGRPMALRRTSGNRWIRQDVPVPVAVPGVDSRLLGVDCITPTVCTAVGTYSPVFLKPSRTLVMRTTNGRHWAIVPSPNPGPSVTGSFLNDVSCVSAAVCTAVGEVREPFSGPNLANRGFVLRTTDGTTWTRAATPTTAGPVWLTSVSCTTPTDCTAVGSRRRASGRVAAVVLRTTNGVSWSTPGAFDALPEWQVRAVDCPAPERCRAVGSRGVGPPPIIDAWYQSLVLTEQ